MRLNAPVVGMAVDADRQRLLARRDATAASSRSATRASTARPAACASNAPIVGMARDGDRQRLLARRRATAASSPSATRSFKGSARRSGRRATARSSQIAGMPGGNGYRMLALPNAARRRAASASGATGAAVTDVQNRLLALGYWLPGVNGVFDANTQQAVYAFQKANGLPRTGVGRRRDPGRAPHRAAVRVPASTSGYVIEIDKTRQILIVASNGARAVGVQRVDRVPTTRTRSTASRYTAHTPEGMFTVIRQVDGPDQGPLGTLWRPKYFTWHGHRGARLHRRAAVSRVARLRARVEHGDRLDLGEQHPADRHDGLGVPLSRPVRRSSRRSTAA